MAAISAAAVKALRERTGLPMMDCKRALVEADGDEEQAIDLLRKAGKKTMEKRAGRETTGGRIAVYTDLDAGVGAMVELLCESAPVANNEEFIQLTGDLVKQLATGPGAQTPDDLLGQPSPGNPSQTLKEQFDDLNHRIREVFRLKRIARIDATCGGYVHHDGRCGVLLEIEGGNAEIAKDVCMHVAAIRPASLSKDDLDPETISREREVQADRARQEGKPENIIEKMVEGRMKNFYAEQCLLQQPFVKDEAKTVGDVADEGGMKVLGFVHWEIGKE